MTATKVPIWTRTSKAKAKSGAKFQPRAAGTRTRWAEDEIGRNSVTPWTTPRRKPCIRVMLVLRQAVFAVGAEELVGKGLRASFQDCLAKASGEGDDRRQIVDGDQGGGEHFAGHDQVAQVGPAEMSAGVAVAFGVDRAAILGV